MKCDSRVHGRMRAAQIAVARGPGLWFLTAILLIAAFGCSERANPKSAQTRSGSSDSSSSAGAAAEKTTKAGAAHHGASSTGAQRHETSPAVGTNHVRLTEHGCVQFDPQWANLRVGQSLVFSSELKSAVTIHVSSGAFDKTEYLVPHGAVVSTGPARAAGSYSMWSDPAACQGASLGAHGTGPGVTVEGAGTH